MLGIWGYWNRSVGYRLLFSICQCESRRGGDPRLQGNAHHPVEKRINERKEEGYDHQAQGVRDNKVLGCDTHITPSFNQLDFITQQCTSSQ
jgi:hypothetical protein